MNRTDLSNSEILVDEMAYHGPCTEYQGVYAFICVHKMSRGVLSKHNTQVTLDVVQ